MVYIYILLLDNEKYYIGKTNNPDIRLDNHFLNNGAEWTKKYKPIKILELIPNCDDYDEDKYTIKYMDKFGINNVRGGSFVTIELEKDTIKFIEKMCRSANNSCFKCGKNGHYIKDCHQNDMKKIDISLDTILFRDPRQIIEIINDINIIEDLQNFKIKIGDIGLNKGKHYINLQDIINDIDDQKNCNLIYNNIYKNDLDAFQANEKYIKMLNLYKSSNLKNLAELLSRLSPSFLRYLQNNKNKTFTELHNTFVISFNTRNI